MELGDFKPIFQHEDDSCFGVTLKVALDKLDPKIKLSIKVINKSIGYGKSSWGVIGDGTAGLDALFYKHLKVKSYTIKRSGGRNMDINTLNGIVKNNSVSPAIVSVSQNYFTEVKSKYKVIEIPNISFQHQLVVSHIDGDTINLFDPYAKRYKISDPNIITDKGIVQIPVANFTDYWDATRRDTIWIHKGKETPIVDEHQAGLLQWFDQQ
jgi:hypothetical protein